MYIILFILLCVYVCYLNNTPPDAYNIPDIQILYNFFSENDFKKISKICKNIPLRKDKRLNSRLVGVVDHTSKVHSIVYKYFENAHNPPLFPMEYRKYFTGSKGMEWHKDLVMFDNGNYYEAVLTLHNSSDSYFEYENTRVWTPPNSLILVKPDTVLHKVSPVTKGERTIIKFLICSNNSIFNTNDTFAREMDDANATHTMNNRKN
jgi:hypothetical protein